MKKQLQKAKALLSFLVLILFFVLNTNAQRNLAPSATAAASTCNTGPCSALNNQIINSACAQEMWIATLTPPSTTAGVEWFDFTWTTEQTISGIRIYHGNTGTRFLAGATVQTWNTSTSAWVTAFTFSGLSNTVCENDVVFPSLVTTTKLRFTTFQASGTQLSNMNFREIEIWEGAVPNDVGITSVISPTKVCEYTTVPVIVEISNRGINALGASLNIPITSVLSGIISGTFTKHFNRALPIGGKDTIHMTTINPSKGVLNIRSWAKFSSDTVPRNDSNFTSLNFIGPQTAMSGTYSVGPTGKFPTIKNAMDSIASKGINGLVTLELQSTYSGSVETFPVTISAFTPNPCGTINVSPRLIIRPASGASNLVIAGNNATALFILNNAYRVTFDGRPGGTGTSRQLSFSNINTAGTVFTLQNDAIRNTIQFCNIRSANTNALSGAIFLGASTIFWGNDSNVISNNLITRSAWNATLASAITSNPLANLLVQNDNNTINNNEIHSWLTNGVNIAATTGNGEKWTITNNSFYDSATATGTASTNWTAINFLPGSASNSVANIISGNFIGGTAINCGGSALINSSTSAIMGGIRINCNPGTPTLVQNNTIQNISFTGTTNAQLFNGINPQWGSLIIGGGPGLGNTIGHASTANSILTVGPNPIIGISALTGNDIVISYNTIANIRQNQTDAALATGAIRGIVNTNGITVNITNNIIRAFTTNTANAGTIAAACLIGIQVTSGSNNQNILDNVIGGLGSDGLFSTAAVGLTRIIGIYVGAGLTLMRGNTINGLNSSAPSTGTITAAAIIGIYGQGLAGSVVDKNEIRNINLTAAAITTAIGIYLGNTTDVTNNIISGITTASTSTAVTASASIQGIYYGTGLPATILNNTLENFSATANAGTQIMGINSIATLTYIKNNRLRNFWSNSSSAGTILSSSIIGIAITSATPNKNITGNLIYNFNNYNTAPAASILGIYYTGATSFGNYSIINNNFIHSFRLATTAVGLMTGIYNASGIATFQNNMIRLGIDSTGAAISGPYNIKGIVHGIASSSNYYNNSIFLGGSSAGTTNTACMEFTSAITATETVNLRNNIFYNNIANTSTGRNACIRIITNVRIFSNYNILFSPDMGGAAGIINATAYSTLTGAGGWNATALIDGQSSPSDPSFISPSGTSSTVDLHLNTSNPAEAQGDPTVTAVLDDFDGQLRSGLTPTDIGADAGNFTMITDKFPPTINLIPLINTSSTSDRTFTVNIFDNPGLPSATSPNRPRVYFRKGTGTLFSTAATLTSGTRQNGIWSFTINASTLGGLAVNDVISYYIMAQDSTGNVISNAMYALATDVNTVTTNPTTPNTYTIVSALATTIQVGSGQTYTTLTDNNTAGLFNAINNAGLQGNTIVEITSDLTESGTIALNQWNETGSGNYTLTIRPSAAARRIVSGTLNVSEGMIRLNGADRVRITGIPSGGTNADTFLLIRNYGGSFATLVLANDAINNTIENCLIEGSPNNSASGTILISSVAVSTGNDNNTIIRSHIRNLSGGIMFYGLFSTGLSPTGIIPINLHDNITIRECHFYNFQAAGIFVNSIGNGNGWRILNNHFYRTNTVAIAVAQTSINFVPGITSNNDTISGNFIGGSAPNAGGSVWNNSSLLACNGIVVSAGTESETQVQNNTIQNLYFSNAGTLATLFTGINILGGNVNVGGVSGNRIGHPSTANSILGDGDVGLIGINSTTAFILTVNNNIISNLTARGGTIFTSTAVRGITITAGTLALNVNNNTVQNLTAISRAAGSTNVGAVVGINVASSGNIQNILNNTIRNFKNLDNIGAHCMVGISLTNGHNIVKGNVISGLVSSAANININQAAVGIMGILMQNAFSNSECSENTISDLQYISSTPTTFQMIGILVNTGTGIKIIKNNISSLNSVTTSIGTTSSAGIIGLSYSGNGTNMIIAENTVHSLNHNNTSTAATVNMIGIFTSGAGFGTGTTSPGIISRNNIHSLKLSTTGAGSIFGMFNLSGFLLVENNMVRVGIDSSGNGFTGPYVVHGIFQSYSNNTARYFHNSVYVGGSPSSGTSITAAFRLDFAYTVLTSRIILANNIFQNAVSNTGTATGKNFAMRFADPILIFSNYNILHAPGTGGITAGTNIADYTNLSGASSWQLATGLDLNSGSGNPLFINATGVAGSVNLRLASANPAERNGDPANTSLIDFDGNTRSSRTPVDIGAHSGNFSLSSDIIAPVITFNPLNNSSTTSGSRSLTNVSITDNVGIPLTGSTIPRIYFSKNGTTWFSSAATTITGTSTNAVATFAIDYSAMSGVAIGDTIRYYVIAQDNAGNLRSNGLYAVATDVNTITTHPLIPLTYRLVPALAAGTKLRVGTGKTYPTLTGAGGLFEYLNRVSLSGNVTAVISSNTTEPGTFALNQLGDNGNGTFTLTIRPDSLTTTERVIAGNLGVGMIRLDGADRIKFTGVPDFNGASTDKKLRFRNSSSGYAFLFLNEAVDNRLHNLNIEGANTSVALGAMGVIQFSTSTRLFGNSRDTVSNCVIGHDQTGILPLGGVPAVSIHSFGSVGKENTANIIMDNEITNFTQHGVQIGNVGNGNNWRIIGNSFYRNLPFPAFTFQQSIQFDPQIFAGGHTISNNFIGGSAKNCGGSPWVNNANVGFRGMSITFVSIDNPTTISNNVIQNISMTNIGTGAQFIGIAIISGGSYNITNNLLGHPTNINSIQLSGAAGHIMILTQSNAICNIRGNAIQGINLKTPGVGSTFLGISLFFGYASAVNNTIGSATVANSIQYAGIGTFSGIQSLVGTNTAPIVLIDSNTIANITATGPESNIQIRGILQSGATPTIITNNRIFNLSTNSSNTAISGLTAINAIGYIGSSLGGTIANNTIYNIRAANNGAVGTSATGIGLATANNVVISNNRIYDITNLSTSTNISLPPTAAGINISSLQNVVTMQNNQISLGTGQTNSPMFIGIWQSVSGNFIVNSYFNSIYIGGTATSGVQSTFGYFRGNNLFSTNFISIVNAKNNIFMNDRKGGTGMHYAIGNQSISTTFQTGWQNNASNYNLLSNSSSYPMGLWNITDYNFSDWKTNSNNDLNSLSIPTGTSTGQINPANLFQNTSIGNLNLRRSNVEAGLIVSKAIPIAGITTDFSYQPRNATAPTIGSSEAYLNDVGVSAITSLNNTCGKPATAITVTVRNFGLASQSNIPIRLVVSGAATYTVSEVVAGPVAPNATVSYTFTGTFNSSLGGTFNVKVFTNLSNEDVRLNDSSTIIFNINPLPKASFTYSDTCAGNTVKFVSTSTVTGGTITANLWRFGDGGTATGNTPNYLYATAGTTYTVKIISTSNNGCIDSSSRAITILSNLVAGVIGSSQTICFNTTPSLIANSTTASGSIGPYTYQWQVSSDNITFTDISGATGISYQPGALTATRFYRRAAKTTAGCGPSFSNVVNVTVNAILTAGTIGSPQTICLNGTGSALNFSTAPTGAFGTYTYQWQSSPDSSTWSNITGQTGTTFTPTNVTSVTFYRALVTSGSCATLGTNGVKITLFSPITGGTIGSGQTICAGQTPAAFTQITAPSGGPGTYTFQWQSSTDSINWFNISGATSSGYASPAVSTLTYFQRIAGSTGGCPSGTSNAIKIRTLPKPNIVFTASSHCFNDPMPLTNTSNISSGSLSYVWRFGDGTTSTSNVPNKTYTSSGTYNVTLVATSNLGCKDSSVKSVVVSNALQPSFTFALKCQGDSVIFTDNTVYACGAGGSGFTYFWNFGDGTTSNVQHARKHYSSPGTYNVKFRISMSGGFKDSMTRTVVFNIRSTPSFTATNNCFPGATTFTNASTNFASLAWSFGDGTTGTSTSSSFTKTYAVAGTYNAKLVATSSLGCKDSVTKTVNVFSKPKADFSVSNNCIGKVTTFNNSSSGAISYAWNFGDGNTSTGVNPSNTYATANTFTVKLKVTSSNGCLDSVTNTVTIFPNPVPNFTAVNVCHGFVSTFTNTSTGASTHSWNFGNGITSTATSPTYTYPSAGTYTVTLTATSSNGCSQTTTKFYTVNGLPKAAFSGSNTCLGNSITFNNTSTGASTNFWNFGDATTSTTTSPAKTYAATGNYNVKLVVTNTLGCKDSVTQTVSIFARPVPAFTATNQCNGTAISFINQSTGAVGAIWLFGDGNSSAATSPNYTYAAAGTYTVKLIVTSVNNCRDSISKSVTVFPRPSVSFTAAPDPICRGGLMTFTNTTTNGATFRWTFGNGNTSTLTNPTNIYTVAGNYNVKLVSVSTNGCRDSASKPITVWPRPVASFSVNNGCTNDNLSFASNSVGAVGHEWTFGDASTSTATNPIKGYTSPSTYNVRLIFLHPPHSFAYRAGFPK